MIESVRLKSVFWVQVGYTFLSDWKTLGNGEVTCAQKRKSLTANDDELLKIGAGQEDEGVGEETPPYFIISELFSSLFVSIEQKYRIKAKK